jgi:hypothetical protein
MNVDFEIKIGRFRLADIDAFALLRLELASGQGCPSDCSKVACYPVGAVEPVSKATVLEHRSDTPALASQKPRSVRRHQFFRKLIQLARAIQKPFHRNLLSRGSEQSVFLDVFLKSMKPALVNGLRASHERMSA